MPIWGQCADGSTLCAYLVFLVEQLFDADFRLVVRCGSSDYLTVILKLHVGRRLRARFMLLYESQSVLQTQQHHIKMANLSALLPLTYFSYRAGMKRKKRKESKKKKSHIRSWLSQLFQQNRDQAETAASPEKKTPVMSCVSLRVSEEISVASQTVLWLESAVI